MYNEVIESRLKKLEAIVKKLETLSNKAMEDFENDFILASALEHNLQVAIQCVLDIGNHIISIENLEKPNDYKDIILILGKNQIIPKKFADAIYKMAGLRNLIIHEYLEIDMAELVSHLNDINDFKLFMKYILHYLEEKARKKEKNQK